MIKKLLAVLLTLIIITTELLPVTAADNPVNSEMHIGNHAYLPFGWISNERSESFAAQKLDLVASYGIDTVYVSLGSATLNEDGSLNDQITHRIDNGLWDHIGMWMALAEQRGIRILPILNCNLNEAFANTTYAERVKALFLDTISKVFKDGFPYQGTAYFPEGIHFDCEPFNKDSYRTFYLDMLKQMRAVLGPDRTLSSATPAANTAWSDEYLAEVGKCLNTINPMLYDSNGPSAWGSVSGGVTQNREEYIQLVENTCLWYRRVFDENNISCEIVPTVPSYPDASTERSAGGWPDTNSTTVWYHLSTIENTVNCILGIQNANKSGAGIDTLGVWNFYYLCGDAKEYQTKVNGFYSPQADTAAWMSWVNGSLLSDIDQTDSLAELSNPERGFYRPRMINLTPDQSIADTTLPSTKLVHLRFGISSLSPTKNAGQEPLFTQTMLDDLDRIFSRLREKGQTAVIRFAYDDFKETKDMEPSMATIEQHIAQLKTVLCENADVIASVEAGFFGPWGEMHSSVIVATENLNRLINALLKSVPESVGITVRRPKFFADWAGIDLSKIDTYQSQKGTDAYRVGVFNDGYLGSESDLGTYDNRKTEVAWLSDQATHTLFGGEAVLSGEKREYNQISYISEEMFQTHTSYLNIEWNDTLIGYWQNEEIYQGTDCAYNGQTAFKYISDHLGYRFVLRSAALPKEAKNRVSIDLAVLNEGCGNVVKEKQAEILFVQDQKVYSQTIAVDVREWLSQETVTLNLETMIPPEIDPGSCKVYMRISNDCSPLTAIQFANANIWNEELGANYLGSFSVTEKTQISVPDIPTVPEKPSASGSSSKPGNSGLDDPTSQDPDVPVEMIPAAPAVQIPEKKTETTAPVKKPSSAKPVKKEETSVKPSIEDQTEAPPASEPNPKPPASTDAEAIPSDPSESCRCSCHSKGLIKPFFWKILRFFCRLIRVHQYCRCGSIHY